MKDPRFAESVIYMVKHDSEGAMGLVINRPMAQRSDRRFAQGLRRWKRKGNKREIIIHYGGPVSARKDSCCIRR